MLSVAVITLFPDMFNALSEFGVTGRAVESGLLQLSFYNPRDYTSDAHRSVDDRPYGGGPGMVMRYEPLSEAIQDARKELPNAKVVYLSPQGKSLRQSDFEFVEEDTQIVLLAGRYEGIDERLLQSEVDDEWSIGDYVISGGELAAMIVIDGFSRQIPGVLGHDESAGQDSFSEGLLDWPHYTRPEYVDGMNVPKVLLSGDHDEIRKWRLQQALGRTWSRRPDLLDGKQLDTEQKALLKAYIEQQGKSEQIK